MMTLRVERILPVGKRGEPWVPVVRLRVGDHDASKVPDWAVERLVKKGAAELVATEQVKVETDPDAAAALAKAKAEQEVMDADGKAKAEAKAAAAKDLKDAKGGRTGGK